MRCFARHAPPFGEEPRIPSRSPSGVDRRRAVVRERGRKPWRRLPRLCAAYGGSARPVSRKRPSRRPPPAACCGATLPFPASVSRRASANLRPCCCTPSPSSRLLEVTFMTAVNSRGDRYGDIGNTVRVLFRWWRRRHERASGHSRPRAIRASSSGWAATFFRRYSS